jgi:hypothetical protein
MVEVTPRGTRGRGFPKLVRTLMRAMMGLTVRAYRAFGHRMRA